MELTLVEKKEIAAELIKVLKEHKLTYSQASEILNLVGETLNIASQSFSI